MWPATATSFCGKLWKKTDINVDLIKAVKSLYENTTTKIKLVKNQQWDSIAPRVESRDVAAHQRRSYLEQAHREDEMQECPKITIRCTRYTLSKIDNTGLRWHELHDT